MMQSATMRSYSTWAFCTGFIAMLSILLLQPLSLLHFIQAAARFSLPAGHSVFAAAFAIPAFWIATALCASGLLGFYLVFKASAARRQLAAAAHDPNDRSDSGEENWMFI